MHFLADRAPFILLILMIRSALAALQRLGPAVIFRSGPHYYGVPAGYKQRPT